MPYAAALSTNPETKAAVDEICARALEELGAAPDLAMLFFSPHHVEASQALAQRAQERLAARCLLGCGGEAMRQAGVDTTVDLRDFALVGITEVIKDFPRAYRTFNRLIEEVDRRKPALAVLIDSPSLNMRLAKKLKRRNIRVIYFVSPQI